MALADLFNDIADAIREKDGTTAEIVANTFPARIRGIPAGGIQLSSISVTTPPDKTKYFVGETFNPAGMVVTATFDNGATLQLDNSDLTFSPSGPLAETDTAITISYTSGGVTATTQIIVIVSAASVYGVQWDGTAATKWFRTDDAALFTDPVPYVDGATACSSPFDNLMPWSGMVKTERIGGTMVAIPKFWYRLSLVGDSLRVQISDGPVSGFFVSPAHMDRGDGKGERDVVYIARYLCDSSYKSTTGSTAKTSISLSNARSCIRSIGDTMQHYDFLIRFTIWLLYLVEMADWDSQRCIGVGDNKTSGHTDSMPYHTGTMANSRDAYGNGTQYRNIEGLWDYYGTFLEGAYWGSDGTMRIQINPATFGATSSYDIALPWGNGYASKFEISEVGFPIFYPVESAGSDSTYVCDEMISSSTGILNVGNRGNESTRNRTGLFFNTWDYTDYNHSSIGARSMELP